MSDKKVHTSDEVLEFLMKKGEQVDSHTKEESNRVKQYVSNVHEDFQKKSRKFSFPNVFPENIFHLFDFDRFFDIDCEMSNFYNDFFPTNTQSYPKYNIIGIKHPTVDDIETLKVMIAVPGCRKKDLDISIDNNVLIVTKKTEISQNCEYLIKGYSTRDFELKLAIPEKFKIDEEATTLENGELTVVFHKTEFKTVKKVLIK